MGGLGGHRRFDHIAADQRSQAGADHHPDAEDGHGPCELVRAEVIGDHRIGAGAQRGLAHADPHPGEQQLGEIAGQAATGGEQRPRGDPDGTQRLAGKAVWIDSPDAQAAWDALVKQGVKKPVPNLVNTADTSGMKPSHFSEAKKTAKRSPLVHRERLPVVAPDEKNFVTIKPINKNVTSVDWLRTTTNDLDAFKSTLSELDGDNGLLETAGFDVKWRQGKGMHGYSESASILLWKDNDYMTVGNLAYSEDGRNKGGMFELTGIGCKVLQVEYPMLWSELHALLTEYAWRISRADVALDMSGEYCTAMGYTVPKLMREAYLNGVTNPYKGL